MSSSTPPASIALPNVPLKSYSMRKIITVTRWFFLLYKGLKVVAWGTVEVWLYDFQKRRTLYWNDPLMQCNICGKKQDFKTCWNSPCTYCSIALPQHHKQCPTEARGHYKCNFKLTIFSERNADVDEYLSVLTSISSSWYSIVGGLPSLFGFSIIGFRTTWGANQKHKQQIKKNGLER